jgi:hypothetical protein
MKNKYISTKSNELLSYFHRQNKNCFDYSLAHKALPDSKASAIGELLNEQIKDLHDFDQVEREVQRHIKKLNF